MNGNESWQVTLKVTDYGTWNPNDAQACAELIATVNTLRKPDNERPCIRRGWWSRDDDPWLDVEIERTSLRLDTGDHLVSSVMPDGSTVWSALTDDDLAELRPTEALPVTARIPGDGYTGGRPAPEEPTALSNSDLDTTGPRLTVSDTDMDELTSDGPVTAALPPDPAKVTEGDRDVATQITGCHREQATDCPFHGTADCGHRFTFCAAHDDARDMAWDECRWAPVAAAIAAERAAVTRPVLALAEELEAWRANAERYADAHAGSIACDRALGRVRAYERAAARLRAVVAAALGETGGGK